MSGLNLHARKLKLSFPQPNKETQVILDIDDLSIPEGGKAGFIGPSGAGKTTLLNSLVGIQPLESGDIQWGDKNITLLTESECDLWRRNNVGIIFQDFFLFPGLTILENVLLPLSFARQTDSENRPESARKRAYQLLEEMELPDIRRSVSTLSRGERQRVAIARALIMTPKIVVADEPTANLDRKSADKILKLLLERIRELGATFLLVSHDSTELEMTEQVYSLAKGHFKENTQ